MAYVCSWHLAEPNQQTLRIAFHAAATLLLQVVNCGS